MSQAPAGGSWADAVPEDPHGEEVVGLVESGPVEEGGTEVERPGLRARVRAALAGLTSSREQLDAEDVRRQRFAGTTPIAQALGRDRVTVGGVLVSVTYPPAGGSPLLRARLFDGTGHVELVFLGRRHAPGIAPGSRLRATGTPTDEGRGPVLYNPLVDLVSVAEEAG